MAGLSAAQTRLRALLAMVSLVFAARFAALAAYLRAELTYLVR